MITATKGITDYASAKELLIKAYDEEGVFEGYASVFGNVDFQGEVVEPGAYSRTLTQRNGLRGMPVLWCHLPQEPIGVIQEGKEDSVGLFVRGKLILEAQRAKEVRAFVQNGAVHGMSIGYRVIQDEWAAGPIRKLKEIDLREISIVTFPANPKAKVQSMKDAPEKPLPILIREFETTGNEERVAQYLVKRVSTEIQTIICSKRRFRSVAEAAQWVREHGFAAGKVDETEDSYRFRQREPEEFQPNSFRTITLTRGVQAVIGRPKKMEPHIWDEKLSQIINEQQVFIDEYCVGDVVGDVLHISGLALNRAAEDIFWNDRQIPEASKKWIDENLERAGYRAPWMWQPTRSQLLSAIKSIIGKRADLRRELLGDSDTKTNSGSAHFAWWDTHASGPDLTEDKLREMFSFLTR